MNCQRLLFRAFTTEEDQSTSPSVSPRRRVAGIADVPLIACQSGSMSDSATSSLENFQLSSVDGMANPAYNSSPSDSDRSTSQERVGDTEMMVKRSTKKLSRSLRVSSMQKTVNSSTSGGQNQGPTSYSKMDDSVVDACDDMDRSFTSGVIEPGKSILDQQLSLIMTDEDKFDSEDSSPHQYTSKPIGAKLVVTTPALNQQNSVRVPAPLPYTCTSLLSNSNAISYSDSELIPRRNSVSRSVAEMVATEHLVTKQEPIVPQVFPSSSGERYPSSAKRKPLTSEKRSQNRAVIQNHLHQWHRSLSAGDKPASRRPIPDDANARGLRPKSGMRSRHLNHTISLSNSVSVHGSADVAGVIRDSLLSSSSTLHPSNAFSVYPNSTANHSSSISTADNTTVPENSSTENTAIQMPATKDYNVENMQSDDVVFDEESGNNESSLAVVVNISEAETSEQSASTSAESSSEHHTGTGVPNRAILRRGSGEWCSVVTCTAHCIKSY